MSNVLEKMYQLPVRVGLFISTGYNERSDIAKCLQITIFTIIWVYLELFVNEKLCHSSQYFGNSGVSLDQEMSYDFQKNLTLPLVGCIISVSFGHSLLFYKLNYYKYESFKILDIPHLTEKIAYVAHEIFIF